MGPGGGNIITMFDRELSQEFLLIITSYNRLQVTTSYNKQRSVITSYNRQHKFNMLQSILRGGESKFERINIQGTDQQFRFYHKKSRYEHDTLFHI